ncbi:D-alanine--D-alanine ligase family protein [Acidaminobacterium chupaoyuni]
MKIRVGVFFGGKSVEHEVSVISAMQAIAALDEEKYEAIPIYITKKNEFYTGEHLGHIESYQNIPEALKKATRIMLVANGAAAQMICYPPKKLGSSLVGELDVILPVTHGTNVEDGALQGFFEYLDIPYAGCDVCASAVGMDKWVMKSVYRAAGLPVVNGVLTDKRSWFENTEKQAEKIEAVCGGYPIIIKPVNLGSSVGIGKASDRAQLEEKIETALEYAPRVLCETCVENLREINCSVLGDLQEAQTSVCEEPLNATDFLTFQDKYEGGGKSAKSGGSGGSKGMTSLSRKVPADLEPETEKEIRRLALEAFRAIDACGVARVDMMMNGKTGEIFVNEINTIPGSLAFYLWQASGVSFNELLDKMIWLAIKRKREKDGLTVAFQTNILANNALGGTKGGTKGAKA